MSSVSRHTRDFSQRECPECGNGNGLRTLRMVGDGDARKALKECYGCGHRCVINYKTNQLEEVPQSAESEAQGE